MNAALRRSIPTVSREPARFVCGRRYPSPTRAFHRPSYLLEPAASDNPTASSTTVDGSPDPLLREVQDGSVGTTGQPPEEGGRDTEASYAAKYQNAQRLVRHYGAALKRVQRRNKSEDMPPIHIPQWFLKKNVTLREDQRHNETGGQLAQLRIEVKDKSTGKPLTKFSFEVSWDQARRLVKRLRALQLAQPDSQINNTTSGSASEQQDNAGHPPHDATHKTSAKVKENTGDYTSVSNRINPWVLTEIKATVAACLSATYNSAIDGSEGIPNTVVLHSPQDFGAASLHKVVESIGEELGADIVRMDAQDIAELAGDYLSGNDQAQSSIRSLGYDTYRMKNEFRESAEEDGLDEEANESEEDQWEDNESRSASRSSEGPTRPIKLSKYASFVPLPILSLLQLQSPRRVSMLKPLDSTNGRDHVAYAEAKNWKHPSQSQSQWDDMKLMNFLEALCDSNKAKRDISMPPSQDKPGSSFFSPSVTALISSEGELNGSEKFEMDHFFHEEANPKVSVTISIDSAEISEKSTTQKGKPKTILLLRDILEMQATKQGSAVIEKLEEIVRKKRANAERITIVGTTCSQDFVPERSKAGIRSMELEGDPLTRMIVVSLSQEDQTVDSIDSFLSSVSKKESLSQTKGSLHNEDLARNAEINLRHLYGTLRILDPTSFEEKEVGGVLSLPIETLMAQSIKHRIFSYTEIYRIALTALGLHKAENRSERLNNSHVSLAMSLLHLSDEAKSASLSQYSKDDEGVLSMSTQQPYPQRDEVVDSLHRTANKYEQRLLGGVINASNIKTTFSDVHAPSQTVEALHTLTSLSMLRPDAFTYGVLATNKIPGLLLYGPPGTGKTLLAKAVAKESGARMLEVSGSDTNQMYVGESEKIIRAIFTLARKLSPCVVFIDEADAIFGSRSGPGNSRSGHRETINQFLREWDGMNDLSVFIMVATNRPYDLDDAVLRRLPRRLLVDLPTKADREKILGIHLKDEALDPSISLDTLAAETPLYSGSDIKNLAVAAALACVKEENEAARKVHASTDLSAKPSEQTLISAYPPRRILHRRHFDKALAEIGASVSEDMSSLNAIKKFDEQFGDRVIGSKKKRKGWGFGVPPAGGESEADRARVRT